jgi:hypothetical protein
MQTRSVTRNNNANNNLGSFTSFIVESSNNLNGIVDKIDKVKLIKKVYTETDRQLCDILPVMKKQNPGATKRFLEILEDRLTCNLLEISSLLLDTKYRANRQLLLETGRLSISIGEKIEQLK